MTDAKNDDAAEPMTGFDETNGVVEGLEGDDGGAQSDDNGGGGGMLGDLLHNIEGALPENRHDDLEGDRMRDADEGSDSGYSEEGRA